MAKYYPDIAKGAKGTFVVRFIIILYRILSFLCKQKRDLSSPREEDLDVVSHRSFSSHLMNKTDLFTGALSYENKFSLDAKPISGGVRF